MYLSQKHLLIIIFTIINRKNSTNFRETIKQLIDVSRFDLFIAFLIILYTLMVFADLAYEDIYKKSSTTSST